MPTMAFALATALMFFGVGGHAFWLKTAKADRTASLFARLMGIWAPLRITTWKLRF